MMLNGAGSENPFEGSGFVKRSELVAVIEKVEANRIDVAVLESKVDSISDSLSDIKVTMESLRNSFNEIDRAMNKFLTTGKILGWIATAVMVPIFIDHVVDIIKLFSR